MFIVQVHLVRWSAQDETDDFHIIHYPTRDLQRRLLKPVKVGSHKSVPKTLSNAEKNPRPGGDLIDLQSTWGATQPGSQDLSCIQPVLNNIDFFCFIRAHYPTRDLQRRLWCTSYVAIKTMKGTLHKLIMQWTLKCLCCFRL